MFIASCMLYQKKTKRTSIFKNEVGIQAIKKVKQEMSNGSYYSIA